MIKNFAVVIMTGLLIVLFSMSAALAAHNDNHTVCPDPFETKVEAEIDGELNDIVPSEGTEFCVKGSTELVNGVGDGETNLFDFLGNGHDVSHYVYYTDDWSCDDPEWADAPFCSGPSEPVPTESPGPEPSPSDTPTPEPTPIDSSSPVVTPEPQEPGDGGEQPSEPVVEELPNTGPEDAVLIGVLGLCLLGAGTWITRKYGWMN